MSATRVLTRMRSIVEAGGGVVREQEPMSRHTTFGVGGPADVYARVHDREALRRAAQVAADAGLARFILGSGSNILVGDGGIRGIVIENKANAVDEPEAAGGQVRLRAEAGASFARLARSTARAGLHGLEWAAGIPGTLGGAVVYNAGAYGGCLADVLVSIDTFEPGGAAARLDAAELGLAYRSSAFTRGRLGDRVITDLDFALEAGDADAALARIATLEERRKRSAPRGRNAGSVFKNPPAEAAGGRPAWWLIDQVGLRGHRIGDAQISEKHTNYFLNTGAARAADVAALIELARRRVHEQFGVELQREVTLVGEHEGGAA